ncbi:MAG: hypothetical protein NC114_10610 [Ruminococcus flavefaciens]|nr:hypothetical protein [Ruminococcus flavefaciens]
MNVLTDLLKVGCPLNHLMKLNAVWRHVKEQDMEQLAEQRMPVVWDGDYDSV